MIVRDQHYVGRTSAGMDLVRTVKRQDATLDPQTLFDDLKFEEAWWVDGSYLLYQISSPVGAAYGFPNSGLVTFGSEWVGQQRAKKERWTRNLRAKLRESEVEIHLDALNRELVDRLQRGGETFVSNAVVGGHYVLRACIVNFHTTQTDVEALCRTSLRELDERSRLSCA